MNYPELLEQWWVRRACERFSCTNLIDASAHLEKEIQTISDRFTKNRDQEFDDLYRQENLLMAYGLFYFPQTFARIQFPLRELIARGWQKTTLRILDLGAGPGAAAMSSAIMWEEFGVQDIEITAIDRSRAGLSLLTQITNDLKILWPRTRWSIVVDDAKSHQLWEKLSGDWDIILVSFAAGELFARKSITKLHGWIDQLSSRLKPQGILIITEPALKETSEKLEQLRDMVVASQKLHIWGPCLHHSPCPLLKEGKFWCHEVRHWNVPKSLMTLNRHLYRNVHQLKFSFLVLGASPPVPFPPAANCFRLVSPMARLKGKYVASGCAADGKIHEYDFLKREMAETTEQFLADAERGDVVYDPELQKSSRMKAPRKIW